MVDAIRVRVCLAVVEKSRILLVPHYNTDAGPVQWTVPGGRLGFGESLQEAAIREFLEETGLRAQATELLNVSEVIIPERPYHSITIAFAGCVTGGNLRPEANHSHGKKWPRWRSPVELQTVRCHPERTIEQALGMNRG